MFCSLFVIEIFSNRSLHHMAAQQYSREYLDIFSHDFPDNTRGERNTIWVYLNQHHPDRPYPDTLSELQALAAVPVTGYVPTFEKTLPELDLEDIRMPFALAILNFLRNLTNEWKSTLDNYAAAHRQPNAHPSASQAYGDAVNAKWRRAWLGTKAIIDQFHQHYPMARRHLKKDIDRYYVDDVRMALKHAGF